MEEAKEESQDLVLQEDQEEESWDEDWEDSDTEEEEGEEERDMSKPRVGGVSSDVPQTGGSNINVKGNTEQVLILLHGNKRLNVKGVREKHNASAAKFLVKQVMEVSGSLTLT